MERIEVLKLPHEIENVEIITDIIEDKQVNDITLRYMMNRELYENYILSQSEQTKDELKEERQFYRNRIFQLCKVLLLNEKERERYFKMNPEFDLTKFSFDVFLTFDTFIKTSIQNFKNIDTTDILQADHPIFEEPDEEYNQEDVKMYTPKRNTLDTFLIKTKERIILPEQKKIELFQPRLKNKGLRKNNIYLK
jgi:23S rRNA G2069 N7-methylase RlmK/C1962 C5-methylase RlmI